MKLKHQEEIKSTLGFSFAHTGPKKCLVLSRGGGGVTPYVGWRGRAEARIISPSKSP